MFIAFIITLLGFVSARRIYRITLTQNILSNAQLTKIGTLYFFFTIIAAITLAKTHVLLWIICFSPQIALVIVVAILRWQRRLRFRDHFYESLNVLILKMKSGKGFRHAFSDLIVESDSHMRKNLNEIRDVVVFSQQSESVQREHFVQQIVFEFIAADRTPHAAVKRLAVFRDRLRVENDFRRRSGQVMQQTRAQSLLLIGLYLAVFVFVANQFGVRRNLELMLISVSLFTAGVLWIYFAGRSRKWKV